MLVRCLVREHITKLKFKSFSLIRKLFRCERRESLKSLKGKVKEETWKKVGDAFKVYCFISEVSRDKFFFMNKKFEMLLNLSLSDERSKKCFKCFRFKVFKKEFSFSEIKLVKLNKCKIENWKIYGGLQIKKALLWIKISFKFNERIITGTRAQTFIMFFLSLHNDDD